MIGSMRQSALRALASNLPLACALLAFTAAQVRDIVRELSLSNSLSLSLSLSLSRSRCCCCLVASCSLGLDVSAVYIRMQ